MPRPKNPLSKKREIDIDEAIRQFNVILQQYGLIIDEAIMDGKLHRCQVNGDRGRETSGAYVGYLDGYPAGYIENFKTGIKTNWKFERNEAQKNKFCAVNIKNNKITNIQKAQKRAEELLKLQEKTALIIQNEWDNAPKAPNTHPYLLKKQIDNENNLKLDKYGNLIVPLYDIDGKLWSLQRITKDGKKFIGISQIEQENIYYEQLQSRKKGCFYTQIPLEKHQIFQICEGYATMMSIQKITQKPTIMAIDSGNLINVCDELINKYPNKEIIIFADNDFKKELENKSNVGLESALKCKEKYPKIQIIFPKIEINEANNITDFNDMTTIKGIEFAKLHIKKQIQKN